MTKNAASLPAQAAGNTFYVALSGSDSNSGTASAPFKTFNYAKRLLQPGDTLRIFGGTYTEPIDLNISGTPTAWITILPVAGERVIIDVQHQVDRTIWLRGNYLKVAGLETRNGKWSCLALTGDYLEVDAMIVTGCMSHSIVAGGKHITIKNSIVHDAVLENQTKTPGNSWGSGIKVELGGEDITIDRNTVYRNYGEGIAATRAKNIRITHNWVYDNYSVNIYVDNSIDVVVTDNLATCTGDPTTLRDGSRPVALAFAEESYSGWGSQLANITASNNVLAFCSIGLADFGAEGSAGGLDHATFEHNTVWGNLKAPISFNSESTKTRNSSLTYNIFNSSVGTHTSTVANVPGLVLNNNYWASNLPPAGSKPLGANDVSGIPVFSQVPRYDDFNSFRQTSVSSALTYGVQFGVNVPAPTATLQPTVLPSPTSTLVPTMPPTPTITRMPTPTILPTPTVAPISTVAPIPTLTRVPTLNPTSTLIPTTTTQPTNATAKRGDINLDGFVDLADIDLLLEVYGQIASVRPRADLTQDGVINAVDYAQLMGLLGS